MHRDTSQTELPRGSQPHVADDDDAVLIDHDRLAESELVDRRCDLIDGGLCNLAGIASIFDWPVNRPRLHQHVGNHWTISGPRPVRSAAWYAADASRACG